MHFPGRMRHVIALVVATLCIAIGIDGHARPSGATAPTLRTKKATKKVKHHRGRRRPGRSASPLASQNDEVVLAPALLRQLQRNLVDAGYLHGTTDGRLTPRTRRALAEFQREYRMTGTGALDRATAEALLGREALGSAALATAR